MTDSIKQTLEGKKVIITAGDQATAADALDNLIDRINDWLSSDGWVCVQDAAMETMKEMSSWGIDDLSIKVVD